MANPSVVSPAKAVSNYLQNPLNDLTVFCAVSYLAGRVLPLMGKEVPPFFDKLSEVSIGCFVIYELGKVFSSPVSFCKDARVGYSVISGGMNVQQARAAQKGDFPREDNALKIGPKVWATYRLASVIFKFASSGLFVYGVLKPEANLSNKLTILGVGLGAVANLSDMVNSYSKMSDLDKDINADQVPAHGTIKYRLEGRDQSGKTRLNVHDPQDQQKFNELMPWKLKADMAISFTFFMMKAVAFTLAMKKVVQSDSLLGRVSHFVKANERDIWGGLFVTAVTTTLAQHIIFGGATIQELTKRNINRT